MRLSGYCTAILARDGQGLTAKNVSILYHEAPRVFRTEGRAQGGTCARSEKSIRKRGARDVEHNCTRNGRTNSKPIHSPTGAIFFHTANVAACLHSSLPGRAFRSERSERRRSRLENRADGAGGFRAAANGASRPLRELLRLRRLGRRARQRGRREAGERMAGLFWSLTFWLLFKALHEGRGVPGGH